MELPQEFITIASLSTPLSCASVVYAISGTYQVLVNRNPKWVAFSFSVILSLLIHFFLIQNETHFLVKGLFGFINGCIIFMTMLGFNAISNASAGNQHDGSRAFYGSRSDTQSGMRRKFNTPWI